MVHILTDISMEAALAQDSDASLLGTLTTTDSDVEPFRNRKIIYLLERCFGIFLEWDLTPAEAWTCIHGAVFNRGKKVDFWLIIDYMRVALDKKVGDEKSPLYMPLPAVLLADIGLFYHHHHILI